MRKHIFLILFVINAALMSADAGAFVEPPAISPAIPTTNTPITVRVRAGDCHGFIFDEGEPQLIKNGNQLQLIAPGVASLTPGHPFCNYPDVVYSFPIGTLPAGSYRLQLFIFDDGYPDVEYAFGSVDFEVAEVATIPATSGITNVLLALLLAAGVPAIMLRRGSLTIVAFVLVGVGSPFAGAQEKVVHILLSSDPLAPTAEEIVAGYDFSAGTTPPLVGLKAEQPIDAEYLIPARATGTFAAYLAAHPNSSRARLERYIVVHYSQSSNMTSALSALSSDSSVEYAYMPSPERPVPASSGSSLTDHKAVQINSNWASPISIDGAWSGAGGWGLVGILDNGLATSHPDLIAFSSAGQYRGGNFLPVLSADLGRTGSNACLIAGNCVEPNVDEMEPLPVLAGSDCDADADSWAHPARAGHGTHVAGLVAANSTNADATHGACRYCGIAAARVARNVCFGPGGLRAVIRPQAIDTAIALQADLGIQVINQSFGKAIASSQNHCATFPLYSECLAIAHALERAVLLVAAAGNDRGPINFPGSHPGVVPVGGLGNDLTLWNRDQDLPPNHLDDCPQPPLIDNLGEECGSNFTLDPVSDTHQEMMAPAESIYSIMYPGSDWHTGLSCGDSFDGIDTDGAGPCTGTSMAAPMIAGISGVLRSINPLVVPGDTTSLFDPIGIRDVLRTTTSESTVGAAWSAQLGYGRVDGKAAVRRMLGNEQGAPVRNRAIPLFDFYNAIATDHAAVATPQIAVTLGTFQSTQWTPRGAATSGYTAFPMVASANPLIPRASTFVLSTEYRTRPNQPPVVPLFLLDRSRPTPLGCIPGTTGCNYHNRDFLLVTDILDLEAVVADGYRFLGRQGYVFQRCAPEPACAPDGAQRLYRQCNTVEDDCAVFLENERVAFEADGYAAVYPASSNRVLGYAYPNVDTDGDSLIDGFEKLIGTNAAAADSDGDGVADGIEYPLAGVPLSDPCNGPAITCQVPEIFADGFQ